MSEHPIFRHYLMSYHEALKGLKASVFDDKFHAVPKKGSAAYNMIQDVRQGKDIEFPTTIKQLIKPEEPRAKPKAGKVEAPKPKSVDFGSTVKEQTEKILQVLFSHLSNNEEKKQAVRKALQILKYKENQIIQEARKPLQRQLIQALQSIKNKPKWTKYEPIGSNPASGTRIVQANMDLTSVAQEIPVFEKSIVEVVEEEIKAEKRQMNKKNKEDEAKRSAEQQEQMKKQEKEKAKVDVESIKAKWGTGFNKKYPSDELFQKMADYGITNSLDYDRNKKDLPSFNDFIFAFGNTFFSQFDEFLEERLPKKKIESPVVPKNGLNKIVVENIEPRMSAPKPTTAKPTTAKPKLTKEQKKELSELKAELKESKAELKKIKESYEGQGKPQRGDGWRYKELKENGMKDVKRDIAELTKQIKELTTPVAATPEPTPAPVVAAAPAPVVEKPEFEMIDGEKIYNEIDWTPSINHEGLLKILNKMYNRPRREPLKWIRGTKREYYSDKPLDINETKAKIEQLKENLKQLESTNPKDEVKIRSVKHEIEMLEYRLKSYINWRPHKKYRISFLYDTYTTDKVIKTLGDSNQEKQWKEILQSTYDKVKGYNDTGDRKNIRNFNVEVILKEKSNKLSLDWQIHRPDAISHHTTFFKSKTPNSKEMDKFDFSAPHILI